MELGKRIKELRLKKNMSLRKFAKNCNLSITYISMMEEKQKIPKEEKLIVIAEQLGVDKDLFLAEAGKVSSDVINLILKHPLPYIKVIKALSKLTSTQIDKLADNLNQKIH